MKALKSFKMPELSFLCIYLLFCLYSPGLSPCCVWIVAVWLRITCCFSAGLFHSVPWVDSTQWLSGSSIFLFYPHISVHGPWTHLLCATQTLPSDRITDVLGGFFYGITHCTFYSCSIFVVWGMILSALYMWRKAGRLRLKLSF